MKNVLNEMLALPAEAEFGLTISGSTFVSIHSDPEQGALLTEVIKRAQSIVVYRCSPGQKAQITTLSKNKTPSGTIILSIGDGANDVNMI
jgi:magnesium-transporting ATPase (P-type)